MSLFKNTNGNTPALKTWLDDFWGPSKFFDDEWFKWQKMPAVNIKDNENEYTLEVAAPGLSKEDFKISIDNGVLHISSERKEEKEEKSEKYTRKEFSYESFSRAFTLPNNVDEESISAKYKDGVLELSLKKNLEKESEKKYVKVN